MKAKLYINPSLTLAKALYLHIYWWAQFWPLYLQTLLRQHVLYFLYISAQYDIL